MSSAYDSKRDQSENRRYARCSSSPLCSKGVGEPIPSACLLNTGCVCPTYDGSGSRGISLSHNSNASCSVITSKAGASGGKEPRLPRLFSPDGSVARVLFFDGAAEVPSFSSLIACFADVDGAFKVIVPGSVFTRTSPRLDEYVSESSQTGRITYSDVRVRFFDGAVSFSSSSGARFADVDGALNVIVPGSTFT